MSWHKRPELQPEFVNAGLREYLARQTPLPASSLRLNNRIAFIGDGELWADLSHFVDGEALHPDAPSGSGARPDLLLIGGDWPRAGDPWREALLGVSESAAANLRGLIAGYRARGIPAVLWVTGEAETAKAYSHLCDIVDEVFVPEEAKVPGAKTLDAGINVKLFNPFRKDAELAKADAPYFRFLIDGAHEISRFLPPERARDLLRPVLRYNTWLLDSTFHHQNASANLHPALRCRFLGHVDSAPRAWLTRMALGVVIPSAYSIRRPAAFRKRSRQAAACKTLVLTDSEGPEQRGNIRFSDQHSLETALLRLVEDEIGRTAREHLAWRETMSGHTLFERLAAIFSSVGVPCSVPAKPVVNIVLPTVRPERVSSVLEMFRLQSYDKVHLTIVANGVAVPSALDKEIRDAPNVKLCFVPEDKTIGYCMNFGIDQTRGDYWAKWDDDDVYGPHYVEDYILQTKYLDFDIAGKGAFFRYVEEHDCIHVRNFDLRDTPSSKIGGGTIFAKNSGRHFAEDGRGGEDKAFLVLARARGDRIVCGDPFNFVQVRRADPAMHTWTLGAHALDLRGPRRVGIALESIVQ